MATGGVTVAEATRVAIVRTASELALELPHARLARVVGDDRPQHTVVDTDLVGTSPCRSIWRGIR
jgi:hypothetical protein